MFVAPSERARLASFGGSEHIDPVEDDVLAETEPLTAGQWHVTVTVGTTNLDASSARLFVRHRNAANDDTLERAVVVVPVDDSRQFEFLFTVDADEVIDVAPYEDLLGTVWAAINYQRCA